LIYVFLVLLTPFGLLFLLYLAVFDFLLELMLEAGVGAGQVL